MASDFGKQRPVDLSQAARWGQQGLFVLLLRSARHGIGRQVPYQEGWPKTALCRNDNLKVIPV